MNRQGCFAEYVALPAFNVFRVPKEIPDEIASFFDPLGNAVHTALSFDLVGEDVLITGAGPIGCMAAAVVRHAGALLALFGLQLVVGIASHQRRQVESDAQPRGSARHGGRRFDPRRRFIARPCRRGRRASSD